jgi:hypothetical protein
MRAKVAVATVKGKTYFLVVKELRRRGIPFISLIPGQPVPAETRVVITTEEEKPKINHPKILTFNNQTEPEILGCEVVKFLLGKETYETVVVGVDPGQVFGVAAIADGAVIETENCFSPEEVAEKILDMLKTVDVTQTQVTVKVGRGVPIYKAVTDFLDKTLPPEVKLEVVGEAGTNRLDHQTKHRRVVRHIVSAIRIAGRSGHIIQRRRDHEQDN